MPRFEKLWLGPLIGAILGFFLGFFYDNGDEDVIGLIFGAILFGGVIGLFLQMMVVYPIMLATKKDLGFLHSEKKFISTILMLAAEMAKADGKVDDKEKKLIEQNLIQNFGQDNAAIYMADFERYIKQQNDLRKLCKVIDYDFDYPKKAHLIYLLVSIAAADGILTESENVFLKRVTRLANIRPASLMIALNKFSFVREKTYQEKSREQARKTIRQSSLKKAYSILGLSESATDAEIKKAYRKLAKIYHPDRVDVNKDLAKEKFQVLVDAYDLIKEKRGIA